MSLAQDPTAVATALVHALERDISELLAVPADDVHPAVLGELTQRILIVGRRVEAVAGAYGYRFARSQEWAADGAKSPQSWLAGDGNESRGSMSRVLDQGQTGEMFPALRDAWASGEVSSRHMGIVDKLVKRYRALRPHMISCDQAIAALARLCEPRRFEQELNALCYGLDPESVDAAERARERDAYLHVTTMTDGTVKVDAHLDAILGEKLLLALEAMQQRVRREEPARNSVFDGSGDVEATGPLAEGPPEDDHRPLSARRLEAFGRLIDLAASVTGPDGLPLVNGARPVLNVLIRAEDLVAEGEARDRTMAWLEHLGVPSVAISPGVVRRLACDAAVQPLVIDRQGRLVAMLPRSRAIAPVLRRAILMRDQHCRFPRCRSRIDEVHHVTYWRHGGLSVKSNLIGLCRYHHHAVHEGGWRIDGDPGGMVTFASAVRPPTQSPLPPARCGP